MSEAVRLCEQRCSITLKSNTNERRRKTTTQQTTGTETRTDTTDENQRGQDGDEGTTRDGRATTGQDRRRQQDRDGNKTRDRATTVQHIIKCSAHLEYVVDWWRRVGRRGMTVDGVGKGGPRRSTPVLGRRRRSVCLRMVSWGAVSEVVSAVVLGVVGSVMGDDVGVLRW